MKRNVKLLVGLLLATLLLTSSSCNSNDMVETISTEENTSTVVEITTTTKPNYVQITERYDSKETSKANSTEVIPANTTATQEEETTEEILTDIIQTDTSVSATSEENDETPEIVTSETEKIPTEKDAEETTEVSTLEELPTTEEVNMNDFCYEIIGETLTDVYIRLSPSKYGSILKTISKGQKIFIANSSINGFTPAISDGEYGYIYEGYVSISVFEYIATDDTTYSINDTLQTVTKGDSIKVNKDSQGRNIDKNLNVITLSDEFLPKRDYLMLMKDSAKKEIVASFSTLYSLSDYYATKAYNINLCCSEVSTVIPKGEDFNWHKIVGNTGYAEGYKQANVFSGGKVVKGYGGGVCQVSTTIYGCVRALNLPVIERHAHGMPVQYVDWYKGEDASVDDIGGFNFIWNNNTGYDILINAYTSTVPENDIDHQGKLTVEFYKLVF